MFIAQNTIFTRIFLIMLFKEICYVSSAYMDYQNVTNWPDICTTGKSQSPIDFPPLNQQNYIYSRTYIRVALAYWEYFTDKRKFSLLYDYKYGIQFEEIYFKDGYYFNMIEVNINHIVYAWKLKYLQIHTPSEHTIEGQSFDLELQILHLKDNKWLMIQGITQDPDDYQSLIVSFLFKANETYQDSDLIRNMSIGNGTGFENTVDLNPYIRDASFYYYKGSLTNVGCYETVHWMVMKDIYTMSINQLNSIKNWTSVKYPKGNSRKIQKLNNRTLYYYQSQSLAASLRISNMYKIFWYISFISLLFFSL